MKLKVEFMPETCWGQSLRKRMSQYQWRRLREQVLEAQGEHCVICGATGRLQCHEVWEYDDVNHVQKLAGFEMICSMCHGVEHYGMTNRLAAHGSVLLEDYEHHFCRVNGVDASTFRESIQAARQIQAERSKHEWTTDLGEWADLATRSAPPRVRRRDTDLDGVFQLPGSTIQAASLDKDGNLELMISGITHHPPAVVHGYPRVSPSIAFLRLTLIECAGAVGLSLPSDIVDAVVSYADCTNNWIHLPVDHIGSVSLEMTLHPSGDVLLSAAGMHLDHVFHA